MNAGGSAPAGASVAVRRTGPGGAPRCAGVAARGAGTAGTAFGLRAEGFFAVAASAGDAASRAGARFAATRRGALTGAISGSSAGGASSGLIVDRRGNGISSGGTASAHCMQTSWRRHRVRGRRRLHCSEKTTFERRGDEIDAPDADAYPRVRGLRRQVGKARPQRDALEAHEGVAHHARRGFDDFFLQQPAQAPVMLHPLQELRVLAVRGLEVRECCEQLGTVVLVGRRHAGERCEELLLVDEVAVAPQRRARPQVVREPQPLVLAGAHAHLHLATGLHAVEAGDARVGEQASPRVVDVDHQLRNQLVERRAARPRGDRHAPVGHAPVDVEAVVDALEVRAAARGRQCLREHRQCAQLRRARRFARLRRRRECVVDGVEAQVRDHRHAVDLGAMRERAAGGALAHRTEVNRVPVVANLRLDAIDDAFASPPQPGEAARTAELRALSMFAQTLAAARGRADFERVDYSFYVDWSVPDGRVTIATRPRGSPLDKLVSELMIHVNDTWGRLLADAGVAGFYRVQSGGKVKMSVRPGEHQGLGLAHYLWSSSPLRRYSDLVNQQQLLATLAGEPPPYKDNDAELFAALADFEATYSQYAQCQERMEHYWCLRWLLQEGVVETTASVVRDNLVRFERIPLWTRLADLPPQAPDTRVRVGIGRIDLVAATLECRFLGTVEPAAAANAMTTP